MALMGEGSTSKLCDSCDRQTARLLGSSCATLLMALLMSCLTSIPGFVLSCWPFKTIPCLLEYHSKFYFVCADFPPVSCLLPFVRRRFASTLSTFTCTICHFCIGSSNGCLEKHFHFHCFAGLSFTFPAIVSWLYLVHKIQRQMEFQTTVNSDFKVALPLNSRQEQINKVLISGFTTTRH